ncbi:hypothetical protein LZ32DRAFT_186698 [Colletotrichum eremochloae]|nr:hypothetical protein LZ32DRAFT_186698 [Colletotrichum eremochloae]
MEATNKKEAKGKKKKKERNPPLLREKKGFWSCCPEWKQEQGSVLPLQSRLSVDTYHFTLNISRRRQPETDNNPGLIAWNGRGACHFLPFFGVASIGAVSRHVPGAKANTACAESGPGKQSESWPDTQLRVLIARPTFLSRLSTHRAQIRQHVNVVLSPLGLARAAR